MRYVEKANKGYTQPGYRYALFDSFTDYVQFAERFAGKDISKSSVSTKRSNWYQTRDYPEAHNLALNGWTAGTQKLKLLADKLDVTSRVKLPEVVWDVVGNGGIDIGRVMSGEPENMLDWQESEQDNKFQSGPIVKIVVNISTSSSVDTDVMMLRGAAVCALIDALEQAGKRVEVDCMVYCQGEVGKMCVYFPVKSEMYHTSPSVLSYALAHPSCLRRQFLAACTDISFEDTVYGYGFPANPTDEFYKVIDKAIPDLYMPALAGHEPQWQSQESCIAWLWDMLEKLGVEIE